MVLSCDKVITHVTSVADVLVSSNLQSTVMSVGDMLRLLDMQKSVTVGV